MTESTLFNQTTVLVVVGFFIVLGIFVSLLFLYTHKQALLNLRVAFRCRHETTNVSSKLEDSGQSPRDLHDLEKGLIDYLNKSPHDAYDCVTMRMVRPGDSGAHPKAVSDGEGRVEDLATSASWVEVVHKFPSPPDTGVVRGLLEVRNITAVGLFSDNVRGGVGMSGESSGRGPVLSRQTSPNVRSTERNPHKAIRGSSRNSSSTHPGPPNPLSVSLTRTEV